MATSESKENMCLVCLEAPAGRKVDTCRHSYCENCLSSPNFACPQCVTEGSTDHGKDLADGHGKEGKPGGTGAQESATKNQKKSENNCKICHFKGKTVEATRVCFKCKKLPLCLNCSNAHGENKATKKHVVTVIQRPSDDRCTVHDELLELVCTSCSENVCHVCISIEHVGHEIETIHKAVFVEFDKVKKGMEYQKEWLEMLKSDEKELLQSKATAQEMEDVLIKSIEDHAEKCIEEILKNKEALKEQVKTDFEVVRVMEKRLEVVPGFLRASGDVIAEANSLLNEQAELHSTYIEKLVALKQQLDKLKEDHPAYEQDKSKYQQTFKKLCEKDITFYPRTPKSEIGGFKDLYYAGPRCDAGGSCVCDTCQQKVTKLPDGARVVECRQRGTCTCGTCGCVFDRNWLKRDGSCKGSSSLCSGQPKQCEFCKFGFKSSCTNRKSCNVKIAVRNYTP